MRKKPRGVISAGSPVTAEAARLVLEAGGNAYDAILSAYLVACLAEPVLTSLGGGGFLLAHSVSRPAVLYDFFTQTPRSRRSSEEITLTPVLVHFSAEASQEYHIGLGSMATPGGVRALFRIHRDLGSIPLAHVFEPAINFAKQGVTISSLQARIIDIVSPILTATSDSTSFFSNSTHTKTLVRAGDVLRSPDYADFLTTLLQEGERFFYEGDIAQMVAQACQSGGGHLTRDDFKNYEVINRVPLQVTYRGVDFFTNPPPSCGGILIAFALKLLEQFDLSKYKTDSAEYVSLLAQVMEATNLARNEQLQSFITHPEAMHKSLSPDLLRVYLEKVNVALNRLGSTTHINVIDSEGNLASMTSSNGETSGYVIPGTGILMNNMMGEADLLPHGFYCWEENQRLSSMMAPSAIIRTGDSHLVLGTGGSNRIRSAILQTILNIVDFGLDLKRAVSNPRIHCEDGLLSVEPGLTEDQQQILEKNYRQVDFFSERHLFFGGVHTACYRERDNQFVGSGDPRREGTCVLL